MDAEKLFVGAFVIFILLCLSGCEEQGVTTENKFENVVLDSELVQLAYANVSFVEKREINDDLEPVMVTKRVDVKYLFENVAGRNITINATVEFYNNSDTLIGTSETLTINLPKDYVESVLNEVSYSGKNVDQVSYVKIVTYPA